MASSPAPPAGRGLDGEETDVELKGVTIGRDSVVAARAVVAGPVPAGTIVAGIPARSVGRVDG